MAAAFSALPAPSRFVELLVASALDDPSAFAALEYAESGALGLAAERHVDARQAVLEGWQMVFPGDEPTLEEIQAIQAIGAHEGQYGRGWGKRLSPVTGLETSMENCNNWGAIQCVNCKPTNGVCCEGCGYWFDSRPTDQGQVYYEQCFRCYPSPAHGAAGIIGFLAKGYKNVMEVLPSGNLDEIAWQMRLGNYFQGFTTDKREAARQYAAALDKQAKDIAAALGEPQVASRKGEGFTLPGGTSISGDSVGGRLLKGAAFAGVLVAAWYAPQWAPPLLTALGSGVLAARRKVAAVF